jgi:predicted metal-dependent hydrolase
MAETTEEKKEQKAEQEHRDVPYEVHKEIVDMLDAHNRRLTYTIVFLIVVIFMIVATGIWFLNQYEYTTETVTVDSSDGVANYLGGDGSITNGNAR